MKSQTRCATIALLATLGVPSAHGRVRRLQTNRFQVEDQAMRDQIAAAQTQTTSNVPAPASNVDYKVDSEFVPSASSSSSSSSYESESAPVSTYGSESTSASASDADFSIASGQSFGFFDDIPARTWDLMKQRFRETPNHLNEEGPLEFADEPHIWYQMNWEPNFTCPNERRIGGMGDGPKWVCNPHRVEEQAKERMASEGKNCLVYSVGSNGNFMFEEALQQAVGMETCEIHVFDPVDFSGEVPPGMTFHNWGIEANDMENKPENFKSLAEIVQILGHEGRVLDIYKIDCEGCEWSTYKDWFNSGVDMRQILVETHNVPENANEFFGSIKENGYVNFHKEPNTWSAGGACQEYAFLKLDQGFFE